jgi:hypothetical protein
MPVMAPPRNAIFSAGLTPLRAGDYGVIAVLPVHISLCAFLNGCCNALHFFITRGCPQHPGRGQQAVNYGQQSRTERQPKRCLISHLILLTNPGKIRLMLSICTPFSMVFPGRAQRNHQNRRILANFVC